MQRRDFFRLAAAGGGAVFGSALAGCAAMAGADDFYFVQLSDCHWGYSGPANLEPRACLPRAVAA
ncbi:MAG: metallophosphoesterase, partial [Burkholderiales bacterium]|nr:metallophosphoesterase [Burkholderiales bacterium]